MRARSSRIRSHVLSSKERRALPRRIAVVLRCHHIFTEAMCSINTEASGAHFVPSP